MKLFEKQVPANSLEARLDAKHVDAAREYLGRFLNDKPADRDRLLQALTVLIMDLDQADHS